MKLPARYFNGLFAPLLFVSVSILSAQDAPLDLTIPPPLAALLPTEDAVLANVNGREIHGAEVRVRMLTASMTEQQSPQSLEHYVQLAIDRDLIEQLLKSRKVEVPDDLIQQRTQAFLDRLTKTTGDASRGLERMGLTEASLRRQVQLSLGWLKFAQQTLTDEQFRQYFEAHREQLDGTRVKLSLIHKPLKADTSAEERASARKELQDAASQGKFEDAGSTEFRGTLPPEVTAAVFQLKTGETSDVIATPQGLYIIVAGERIPGQLSLEDVRLEVLSKLAQKLWDDEVARLRERARIQLLLP